MQQLLGFQEEAQILLVDIIQELWLHYVKKSFQEDTDILTGMYLVEMQARQQAQVR